MKLTPKYVFNLFYVSVLILSVLSLSGCPNFFGTSGPVQIDYTGKNLVLSWDNDDSGYINTPSSTDHYNLYYRPLGAVPWEIVSSVSAVSTVATIFIEDLGYGKFEFAVEAVYKNHEKSSLHTSTDFSAKPSGGWYLNWYKE